MTENQIISVLTNNSDIFVRSSIAGTYIFRPIIWTIIKGLVWLSNICQDLYNQAFKFLDFTTYAPVQSFLEEFNGIIVVVLAVSLLIIAVTYMFNQQKKSSFITNLLVGLFVICSATSLLSSFNSLLIMEKDYIVNGYGGSGQAANQIIADNMTDILYIDKMVGLKNVTESNVPHNSISSDAIKNIEYGDVVKPDSEYLTTSAAKDVLSKKAVYVDGISGLGYGLEDIKDGNFFTDIFAEYYYRYNVNFLTVLLSLISLDIVFLVMGYKVIRLIWELVTAQFLAVILAGEIASGQSMKKLLDSVKNIYIVLIYTMVSVKFYLLAASFINSKFSGGVKGFILLFVAFAVADGPVIVEKILGIDAGLQSGIGKGLAVAHMFSGAVRTGAMMVNQHQMKNKMDEVMGGFQNIQNENASENASGDGNSFESYNGTEEPHSSETSDMNEGVGEQVENSSGLAEESMEQNATFSETDGNSVFDMEEVSVPNGPDEASGRLDGDMSELDTSGYMGNEAFESSGAGYSNGEYNSGLNGPNEASDSAQNEPSYKENADTNPLHSERGNMTGINSETGLDKMEISEAMSHQDISHHSGNRVEEANNFNDLKAGNSTVSSGEKSNEHPSNRAISSAENMRYETLNKNRGNAESTLHQEGQTRVADVPIGKYKKEQIKNKTGKKGYYNEK